MSTISPNWVTVLRYYHIRPRCCISFCNNCWFFSDPAPTHGLLVSGLQVQCIDELHRNVSFGQACFLVHAREVPVSQAKKASANQGTRKQWF